MDILRGVALLGVLLMNFAAFAGQGWMATEAQLKSLPTYSIDWWAYEAVPPVRRRQGQHRLCNAVSASVSYIQDDPREGMRGSKRVNRRRLFWLLLFGWLNFHFPVGLGHPQPLRIGGLFPAS
jgi:uncharacterized membrane protein YeiB